MTTKEKIKIGILAFLLIWIAIVISSGKAKAQSSVRNHAKLQKEMSYETWLKNEPKNRINQVKSAVNQSKDIQKKRNKTAKLVRREEALRAKIAKL
jgi:hypothetical protein